MKKSKCRGKKKRKRIISNSECCSVLSLTLISNISFFLRKLWVVASGRSHNLVIALISSIASGAPTVFPNILRAMLKAGMCGRGKEMCLVSWVSLWVTLTVVQVTVRSSYVTLMKQEASRNSNSLVCPRCLLTSSSFISETHQKCCIQSCLK